MFLVDERQTEDRRATHSVGTQEFSTRELFDRLAGLASRIYNLDIFMMFEPDVPERVIGVERDIASA